MPSWDPTVYARFAAERARPFTDLVARIAPDDTLAPDDARGPDDTPAAGGVPGPATDVRTVVDLGCGPGDLTVTLARRWPRAQVVGVDSSPTMLERARSLLDGEAADVRDRVRFEPGDAATWQADGPVDVIVTNALLQWVPIHLDLLPRWMGRLRPGGWFAMQVPGNFDALTHRAMRELTLDVRFVDSLQGVLRGSESVAQPSTYAALLAGTGAAVDVWETTYLHVLDPEGRFGDDAVLAWMSGTGLRPVLDALADDPPLQQAFLDEYTARLREAYPRRSWGTLLPFRRIFAVARAASGDGSSASAGRGADA
jgi:trans-aconitate 2-methyltransferase